MPLTSVTSDPAARTLTVVGEYPVPVERLWDAWADPRRLEKFWGPPTWPATFVRHDMSVGGRSEYWMTGPEGERARGYWRFEQVDPGVSFTVVDGFADQDGSPDTTMPTFRMSVVVEATGAGSRFTATTTFPDLEAMERLVAMGVVEGQAGAFGQLDDLLADLAAFAQGRGTTTDLLSDTLVRVSRVVRGTVEQVWRAHQEPELVRRWLLGPDGWTMPVCEVATAVGGRYRYEWAAEDGSASFGFEGELLEHVPPTRSVTTEQMIGTPGPATRNELTLTALEEGTLLSLVITYPDAQVRDMVLATGMTDGMETSYRRLEDVVLASV